MILTVKGPSGSFLHLDFRSQLSEFVELCCFHFVTPPIEFRLMRGDTPLQAWQTGNTEMYDLQHGPGVEHWCRDGHWFLNDMDHRRRDISTCGVWSKDLLIATRGLGFDCTLLVWPREGTWRLVKSLDEPLTILGQ